VPAQHHYVQHHRSGLVERGGPAQNVVVRINPAVKELIARSERIEQARPAPLYAEHHRIAPNDRQFPQRVAGGALQSKFVNLEYDRASTVDQYQVRPQIHRLVVE